MVFPVPVRVMPRTSLPDMDHSISLVLDRGRCGKIRRRPRHFGADWKD